MQPTICSSLWSHLSQSPTNLPRILKETFAVECYQIFFFITYSIVFRENVIIFLIEQATSSIVLKMVCTHSFDKLTKAHKI